MDATLGSGAVQTPRQNLQPDFDSPAAQKVLGILVERHGAAASPCGMDLSRAKLTPHDLHGIMSWACVQTLDLSHNALDNIPQGLSRLTQLRELNLSHNHMEKLPADIVQLTQLRSLDLSYNDLRDDAISVSRVALLFVQGALVNLVLNQNSRLSLPPSDFIERGVEAVRQFCIDLIQGEALCWTQTMLVVGQQEAGKTALCHSLAGSSCLDRPQQQVDSTVGIDTLEWKMILGTAPGCDGSSDACAPPCPVRVRVRQEMGLRSCFNGTRLSGSYRGHVSIRGHTLTLPDSKGKTQNVNLQHGFLVSCSKKPAYTLELRSGDDSSFLVGDRVVTQFRGKWRPVRVMEVLKSRQLLRAQFIDPSDAGGGPLVHTWPLNKFRWTPPHRFKLYCTSRSEADNWLRVLRAACGHSVSDGAIAVSDTSLWYSGCWRDGGTLTSDSNSLLQFHYQGQQHTSMEVELISAHLSVPYLPDKAMHVLHDRNDPSPSSRNAWIVRTDVPLGVGDVVRRKEWPHDKKGKLVGFEENDQSVAHVRVGAELITVSWHKLERFFRLIVARNRLKDFAGQVVYYDTHKWFIARRSVLALAVNLVKLVRDAVAIANETYQRAVWWLRMIRQRTTTDSNVVESRVILVGTHADKLTLSELTRSRTLLLDALRTAFEEIPLDQVIVDGKVFEVDSHTMRGIADLRYRLHQLMLQDGLTFMGKALPASYLKLEDHVREKAVEKAIIRVSELRGWSDRTLGLDEASFNAAIRYIHRSSTALWFGDEPALQDLRDFMFAQPQWLTRLFAVIEQQQHNKVHATLDPERPEFWALTRQGILSLELLRQLWCYRPDKEQHSLTEADEQAIEEVTHSRLIRLLLKFGVFRDVLASPLQSGADATPLLSPLGNRDVLVPCMLKPALRDGDKLDSVWAPWYHPPTGNQRLVAVRFEITQKSYSCISLMTDILDRVLPNIEMKGTLLNLRHGALVLDIKCRLSLFVVVFQWFRGYTHYTQSNRLRVSHRVARFLDPKISIALLMRQCSGKLCIDLAVRQRWAPSITPLRALNRNNLREQLITEGFPEFAARLHKVGTRGDDLKHQYVVIKDGKLPVFFMPGGDANTRTRLAALIQTWQRDGVYRRMANGPLEVVWRNHLATFVRAIQDALQPNVTEAARCLVLSPAALKLHGLRAEGAFSFGEAAWARQHRVGLVCPQTKLTNHYRELIPCDAATLVQPQQVASKTDKYWTWPQNCSPALQRGSSTDDDRIRLPDVKHARLPVKLQAQKILSMPQKAPRNFLTEAPGVRIHCVLLGGCNTLIPQLTPSKQDVLVANVVVAGQPVQLCITQSLPRDGRADVFVICCCQGPQHIRWQPHRIRAATAGIRRDGHTSTPIMLVDSDVGSSADTSGTTPASPLEDLALDVGAAHVITWLPQAADSANRVLEEAAALAWGKMSELDRAHAIDFRTKGKTRQECCGLFTRAGYRRGFNNQLMPFFKSKTGYLMYQTPEGHWAVSKENHDLLKTTQAPLPHGPFGPGIQWHTIHLSSGLFPRKRVVYLPWTARPVAATSPKLRPTCPHYEMRCRLFLRMLQEKHGVNPAHFDPQYDRCYCSNCWSCDPKMDTRKGPPGLFCIGMRVRAGDGNPESWRAGRVEQVKTSMTFQIKYDDGRPDQDTVPAAAIHPVTKAPGGLHLGMRVRVQGSDGRIVNKHPENTYVIRDEKTHHKTEWSASNVRPIGPGLDYVIPRGWYRFGLKVSDRARLLRVFEKWCVTYHGTKAHVLSSILTQEGRLMKPGETLLDGTRLPSANSAGRQDDDVVYTSQTPRYAGLKLYAQPVEVS